MMCPDCLGSGRIRKRFLLFFTRRARCPRCLGTGEYPPPARVPPARAPMHWRDEDDRDVWPSSGYAPTTREPSLPSDNFEVGSGGRSGGGGASASWGDASDNAPIIADPFSSNSSGASSAAGFESAHSSAGSDDASSSSDSSSSDTGTSY